MNDEMVTSMLAEIRNELAAIRQDLVEIRSATGPLVIPMGDGTALIRRDNGQSILVPMNNAVAFARELDSDPVPGLLAGIVARHCGPDPLIVDIGAGFGQRACLLAGHLADRRTQGARIVAIEPDSRRARLLRRNVQLCNDTVAMEVLQLALGATANVTVVPAQGSKKPSTVTVETLDGLFPFPAQPALICIGAGQPVVDVLAGAQRLTARSPHLQIVVEVTESHPLEVDAFWSMTTSLGLAIRHLKAGDTMHSTHMPPPVAGHNHLWLQRSG